MSFDSEASHQIITAVYASTSGNTEFVVETVAELWQKHGLIMQLHRAEQSEPRLIVERQLFLLASSTWEHGELNPFFKTIFNALKEVDCSDKRAVFIGTGDTRYEPVLFCGGMEQLKKRWLDRGGREIGEALKINGEPYHQVEDLIVPWAAKVATLIQDKDM